MSTLIRSLWRASNAAYPACSWRANAQRVKFLFAGLLHQKQIGDVVSAKRGTPLNRLCRERPEMLGLIAWPYINACWTAKTRLIKTKEHSEIVSALDPPLDFSVHQHIELVSLQDKFQGAYLIVDQPAWFMREGLFTINLMIENFRAYSITFSFMFDDDGNTCAVIGGIQGRNTDAILSLYRSLTKSFFGMRPRDLLLESLKMFLRTLNVSRLLAVREHARHHRHRYFHDVTEIFATNYDDIWEDRGGTIYSADYYELDLTPQRRDIASVKQKKRGLYRKRFEYLNILERRIQTGLEQARPVPTKTFD